MDTRPEQPPEGKLIAAAAERLDLSIREAAKRAGISYGRWRQITAGYQNVSPGVFAQVAAPARTLARMAATVGITPEEMETAGQRPDAADIMRAGDIHPRPPQARTPAFTDGSVPSIAALQRIPEVRPFIAEVVLERANGEGPKDDDEAEVRAFRFLDDASKDILIAGLRWRRAGGRAVSSGLEPAAEGHRTVSRELLLPERVAGSAGGAGISGNAAGWESLLRYAPWGACREGRGMSSPARRGKLDPAELDGKLAAGLARNEHAKAQLDRLERLAGSDAGLLCSDAVRADLDAIRAELAESSDQISSARAAYRDYLAELFTQSILAPPPAAPDVPRQRSHRKPHVTRQNPLMRLVDGGTDRLRGFAVPAALAAAALHLHLGVSRATALKLAGGAAALAVSAGTISAVQQATAPPSSHVAASPVTRGAGVDSAVPITPALPGPVVAVSVTHLGRRGRRHRQGTSASSSSLLPALVPPSPSTVPAQPSVSASQGPAEGHLVIPVTSIVASPAGTGAVNLDASSDGPVPWGMVCQGAACSDLSFSVTHGEIPAGMASYVDFTVDQAGQAAGGTVTLLFSGGTTRNLPVVVSWQAVPQAQPSVTVSPVVTAMPAG